MASSNGICQLAQDIHKETETSNSRQQERLKEQEIAKIRMRTKEIDHQKEQSLAEERMKVKEKDHEKEQSMAQERIKVKEIDHQKEQSLAKERSESRRQEEELSKNRMNYIKISMVSHEGGF